MPGERRWRPVAGGQGVHPLHRQHPCCVAGQTRSAQAVDLPPAVGDRQIAPGTATAATSSFRPVACSALRHIRHVTEQCGTTSAKRSKAFADLPAGGRSGRSGHVSVLDTSESARRTHAGFLTQRGDRRVRNAPVGKRAATGWARRLDGLCRFTAGLPWRQPITEALHDVIS